MKTPIDQDGGIGNARDIQPFDMSLPDFTIPDPGVAPAPAAAPFAFATSAAGVASPPTDTWGVGGQLYVGPELLASSIAYAPLVITPVFGTSITGLIGTVADPTTAAEVEAAINAAVAYYDTNWSSDVPVGTVVNHTTVNTVSLSIEFDYGTLDNSGTLQALTSGSGASRSAYGLTAVGDGHYSAFLAAVSTELPNLPATDPTGGGVILETDAQSQLLGLSAGGSGTAGGVGLNSIANGVTLNWNLADQSVTGEIGAVGAIEHEMSEVMGRVADLGQVSPNTYSILDLYRFTAANTHALTAGASDYFSLNNGTTALGYFNDEPANLGDAGDWDSSGTHNVPADSYDAFLTTGTAGTISSLDTMVLSNIGLHSDAVPARTLVWTGSAGTGFATATNWNDVTDSLDPAQSPPGAADTAHFLTNGGTITGTGTAAALEFGGNALWNVASGASLNAVSNVTVGQGGTGSLLINGGASITGQGASDSITGAAGSGASVTVDGTGSAWKSAGELIVGNLGGGNLTVSDNATVSAAATASLPAVVLGAGAGGNGVLSVTGLGSDASVVGQLDVGEAGAGQLQITNQATIATGDASVAPSQGFDIAEAAGGSGGATVSGAKSLLTNTGAFIVGDAGLGSLSVEAGGSVITTPGLATGVSGLAIANGASASGSSVNVSGSGSNIKVTGLLDVGVNGSGLLQISGGASVTAGSLDAANVAAAVGQIGVSGAGSSLIITNAATVADDGTGVMSVLNGATFTAASLTIGSQGDSSGALVVSGSGSAVDLTGSLNIGTANGTGDLTVGPGAAITASAVFQQGQVVLEGGLLDPTVQLINQGQTAGGFGTIAAGDIVDEGAIQAGGNKASQKLLIVQGIVLGGGTLAVNGTQPGSVPSGILQINAGGTLELSGAVLNAATTTFTDNLTPQGTYTVNNSVIDVNFVDSTGVLLLDDIGGFAGTITTYQAGDRFVATGETLSDLGVANGNTLTVSDTGSNAGAGGIDQIIFGSAVSAAGFKIVNNNTIQAQAPCFAAGTLIETEAGPVPVESLTEGDTVRTVLGGPGRVVWVGSRSVDCARHPRPEAVWPVRIARGAFGENLPARDLFVSPDHAIYVDDVLIPAKHLLNGTTIRQVERSRVIWHHIELARHDVVLAEGLPAETYLDTGDRARFSGGPVLALHPDFSTRLWESLGCASLIVTGPRLNRVRQRLSSRAMELARRASRRGEGSGVPAAPPA